MKFEKASNGRIVVNGEPVLTKYVRDNKNRKIGLCVATMVDGSLRYGFSQVNFKAGDSLNSKLMLEIALGRALNHPEIQPNSSFYEIRDETNSNIIQKMVPQAAQRCLQILHRQATNYFRNRLSSPQPETASN